MAEFKLGRIRFVWKNTWSSGNVYYQDDVVAFGGKIYICVIGHTSSTDFFSDFDINPPKWNLVSDGQAWTGFWQTDTAYIIDNIVQYGSRLYICNTPHTSAADSSDGLEVDSEKWDLYAEGLDWKGDWAPSARYIINDLVRYGGQSYLCNTPHTSASTISLGLENDIDNWDKFYTGVEYKSAWIPNIRYKENDIVQYGASLYIAITPHTSTDFETDEANWEQFVQGLQFENEWSPFKVYQKGDIVTHGGYQYVAIENHSATVPSLEGNTDWLIYSKGLKFLGEYQEDSTNQEYLPGEVVSYGGYSYLCIKTNVNQSPLLTEFWQQLSTGLRWRGEWLDDQEYILGDIVRFNANAYVCILGHISEGDDFSSNSPSGYAGHGSRPDQDDSGQYWSLLNVGSETSVLTTKGDLVYYSDSGPARLPIGAKGEVLQVSDNNTPEWVLLGQADDVYYVAGHGANNSAPENGLTIDRPWASIRYACEQVDRGTKNPQARKLLELNRQFIQREILEWTEYQITNEFTPFTSSFAFDTNKCQRDMGLIIDALIWDITHGGNVKSREAALAYVNDTVGSPYLNQKTETVASINYGLTLIGDVLSQSIPEIIYQVENGDNSTAIVPQYLDATLVSETGVLAEITTLVGIITDAITAGNADNIPVRLIRNVLIKVSTGKYYETLPIIVPAETCVIGDELRSTNVQPRKSSNSTLTSKSDVPFSYKGIERIEGIIGDIVKGVEVNPTSGNTVLQDRDYPVAEQKEADAVIKLARTIKRRIDFGVGNKIEINYPKPYDMSSQDLGYARDLILLNKDFLRAEVIAFVADQYPLIKYSKTKCKQDVGYILDAVAYDLTYGGDWQSTNAGYAYFDGNQGTLQIDSSEKTATIAVYNYLKNLLPVVGRNVLETNPKQTAVVQVRGKGSSIAIDSSTDPLITKIVNIITNGPDGYVPTYPSLAGVDASLISASDTLVGNLKTIQESTIDFISKNFGSFKYDSSKCRRDLRNILNDIAYDGVLNTNYNAIFNGLAYTRPNNAYNLSTQRIETIGAIEYAGELANTSVTTDGSSAVGSTTYRTRLASAISEITDIIENGAASADTILYPSPTSPNANRVTAKNQLQVNKDYIVAEIVAYIENEINQATNISPNPASIWYNFEYNSTKCARDVGYIVEAMSYDMLYEGTQATTRISESYFGDDGTAYPAGQSAQTADAYDYLATVLSAIIRSQTIGPTAGNGESQDTGTYGDAGATLATEIDGKVQIIEDVITAGNLDSLPTVIYPNISNESAEFLDAKSNLESDIENIIVDTIQYINTTYNSFNYDQAKCQRDIGLIVDAARYDWMLGSNFASTVAAISYLREQSSKVVGEQKAATLAANEFARTLAVQYVNSNATAITGINDTWELVQDAIFAGSNEGGLLSVDNFNTYSAIRQIELNKDFIVQEVHSYVDDYFSDVVRETLDSTNSLTINDTSWLSVNDPVVFETFDDSTAAITATDGITEGTTYYVKEIVDDTSFTISATIDGSAVNVTDAIGQFRVRSAYTYSQAACTRDVMEYLYAIQWDMQYPQQWIRAYTDNIQLNLPASYKTRLASRYYVNSVLGSQEEDMYYLRNGTGLRLQTLDGLEGDLTPANEFGTSRVTAGAYASLDPGWGPDDERVWITARSPYVQNLTTFGYAATGQKIDGALHNGGNDSIVSNDFTQVISDGIGAHILNNGRAELVSVFTYYSHIGYLAETGGRIRATNGNNSYGTFGSVAEGVDPDEIPITAVVDNSTQFNADIADVVTNNDEILTVEYSHAGNEYTDAVINFFGAGDNEETRYEDFRDNALFQARLIRDPEDSEATIGGAGYTIVQNTAQTGDSTSLTIAATDGASSTAYVGMTIALTGGAGVGQYGIISAYNSGTKIANVYRASDGQAGWDHFVPGTAIVNPNASTTYQIEPTVTFSAPESTSAAKTLPSSTRWTCVDFLTTAEIYASVSGTSSDDGRNASFTITRSGSKYYVALAAGGVNHTRLETITIDGASLGGDSSTNDIVITITSIDNDGAVVDFDFTGTGRAGLFIAASNNTAGAVSVDGNTWSSQTLPAAGGSGWFDIATGVVDDGSSELQPGYAILVGSNSSTVAYSSDGTTWATVSLPGGFNTTSAELSVSYGQPIVGVGRFVITSSVTRDVVYSDDGGLSWILVPNALPAGFTTGRRSLAYGKGLYVAVEKGTAQSAYSSDGITWSAGSALGTATWEDIAYGSNRFIAVSSTGNDGAYSLDGKNWTNVTLPDIDGSSTNVYQRITFGQGIFVATSNNSGSVDDYNTVSFTEDGVYWQTQGVVPTVTDGMLAVGFGNPDATGQFIAIDSNASTNKAIQIKIGAKAKGRTSVANEQVFEIRIFDPGSNYSTTPTVVITDPNNTEDAFFDSRIGNGVLPQPSFINRGAGFLDATAEIAADLSNGFADFVQTGDFVAVKRLTSRPVNGSNVVFAGQPNTIYKLVNTVSFLGENDGSYTAFLQLSPEISTDTAPSDLDAIDIRIRFSQVRLTGHDFLDIGTGNFVDTNYPGEPVNTPNSDNETVDNDGGRVFFTATDQDGNFRVGPVFAVEQATGIATLNAEAFNIAGLQELSLGEVTLGGNSASITEFSTDPFFTANSDSVVPTQRAVKAYIEAQIGGGGAALNVNSVTAGDVFINTNQITTVSGEAININARLNFTNTVIGLPIAYNYFLR